MKISIVGSGHVGLISGVCFAEKGHDVLCVDHDTDKLTKLRKGEVPFYEPGLPELLKKHVASKKVIFSERTEDAVEFGQAIFICVGTPSTERGKADMSYVERVARTVAENLKDYRLVIEKSTVPIKTSERIRRTISRYIKGDIQFDVASNPEFLREGSAIEDTLKPDRVVVGVDSAKGESLLREIYGGFDCPIVVTSVGSAELIKHASNSFLALKITYANWLARLCEVSGADVDEVVHGMGLDHRIGHHFFGAGIGYGGSCFPKDVDALAHISEELGLEAPMIRLISDTNKSQLENFYKKIESELWVLNDKTLAIWGLAFKPNTDDLREAPALRLINLLKQAGAKLRVHDPVAMPNTRKVHPDLYYANDPMDAVNGADALIVCTEWPQYKEADLAKVKAGLRVPLIFDGRNCIDRKRVAELGMTLFGIGKEPVRPEA
ncbi:MAG: UDP-glucose/GDP-mannose dehydrogenase family protein [Planctomycetes bacterium]|nr:UDP-glucose/GDP-mannose dehydrogenase family protein [Planctomycetota bacterium]